MVWAGDCGNKGRWIRKGDEKKREMGIGRVRYLMDEREGGIEREKWEMLRNLIVGPPPEGFIHSNEGVITNSLG